MRLPAQVSWLSRAEIRLLAVGFMATVCEKQPQETEGNCNGLSWKSPER